jgi:hypothetical protein
MGRSYRVRNERWNPADNVRKQRHRDECGDGCDRADLGGRWRRPFWKWWRSNSVYYYAKRVIRMEKTIGRNTDVYNIWAIERDCVDGVFVDCDIGCGVFAPCEHDGPYGSNTVE